MSRDPGLNCSNRTTDDHTQNNRSGVCLVGGGVLEGSVYVLESLQHFMGKVEHPREQDPKYTFLYSQGLPQFYL